MIWCNDRADRGLGMIAEDFLEPVQMYHNGVGQGTKSWVSWNL
jgi:hypothetical protein